MADFDRFLQALTLRLCRQAQREVRRSLKSSTLNRALRCRLDPSPPGTALARLAVPHYWAVYYHDGRGPVKAKKGKFLVYFRSIEDDPRVSGSASPERFSQTKRLALKPATFRRLVAQGKMIVTKSVGPAAPNPFFLRLADYSARVGRITRPALSRFVMDDLRRAGVLKLKISGTFPLRF